MMPRDRVHPGRGDVDLLGWPIVGPFLRWRHARTTLQLVLLAAAAVVVLHGFIGPDIGSANLATVLTWVHYRGLLVVVLLAAGNFFCTGCPFIRVRDWARRLHMPSRLWPARLGGKWMALALFVAVLFTYELFDLWALPRATAWLVLAYFATALAIDTLFSGATFCKHLCPIGQFNFVASTLSPLEVRIREQSTCDTCATADCIKGRYAPAAGQESRDRTVLVQRGCELGLYLPAKVGNIDCTFCLDCVQACPHDNVALAPRPPGLELADDRRRSGIGRLAARPDLAWLSALFVFGALVNAFSMTAAGRHTLVAFANGLGRTTDAVPLAALFVVGLFIAPVVIFGGAAFGTRWLTARTTPLMSIASRYVHGLVPLGFGIWLAHYGFHLLTGVLVVVPVTQSAAVDLAGVPLLGEPLWRWSGVVSGAVLPFEVGAILLGAMGSLGVLMLIAAADDPRRRTRALLPWALVVVSIAVVAVLLVFQPMDLRGTGGVA